MFKNMPWSSHEGDHKDSHDEEESLTSILDDNQRGELTLFIASITAAMRKTIELSYDAAVCTCPSTLHHSSLTRSAWINLQPRAT